MSLILDIETETHGADVMAGTKRILSVQIGDSRFQELYYADSPVPESSLAQVPARLAELVNDGTVIAGYNIKGFDLVFLQKFLGVEIPAANVLELMEQAGVKQLQSKMGRRSLRMEEVCRELQVPVDHKRLMDERALAYKTVPELVDQAQIFAEELVSRHGWTHDFALRYTLDKLAVGNAILDAYREFVAKRGSRNTLFYRYATGDVISEYLVMRALQGP